MTMIGMPWLLRPAATGALCTAVLACLLALPAVGPVRAQPAGAGGQGVSLTITNTPQRGPSDLLDDHYVPGSPVTYVLQAANGGSGPYQGRLRAALPEGITRGQWRCAASGGARCPAAQGDAPIDAAVSLAPGAALVYTLVLEVPARFAERRAALQVDASLQPAGGGIALSARDSDPAQAAQPLPSTSAQAPAPTSGERTAGAPVVPALPPRSAPPSPTPAPPRAGGLQSTSSGLRSGLGAGRLLALSGPFTQCGPEMYITQAPTGQDNTTLSRVDTSSVPFTLIPLGTGSVPYNAVGFRPADNFLYGIRIGTANLVRIHSDGSTEVLGAIAGLPAPTSPPVNNSYNAGEIGTDGFLYVKTQSTVTAIYRIDLSTLPGTATRINLVGGTVSGADMAWINGRLYTVNQNGTVAWINPATGQVTTLPVANGALGNVGALFGTPTALYGSRNDPGGFYEFDLVTGAATRLSGSPVVGSNDGAHCASAAITFSTDVGVTKTNTPEQGPNDLPNDTYLPGSNVVYSIVVSNRGPIGVQNLRVQDALPPGITIASWDCRITQGGGQCGQTSGTGAIDDLLDLEFDEATGIVSQATYTLTVAVPLAYPQSHPLLANKVVIELPTGFIDVTPGDNSATDEDPAPQADLRVVKTTPSSSVRAGDTIQYQLTATNLGPADVNDALLSDTPNSHLDCTTPTQPPSCSATGAAVCPAGLTRAGLFGTGVLIPSLPANNGAVVVTVSCLVVP